ncbi:thiolase family protein [Syntrophomonas curvata]
MAKYNNVFIPYGGYYSTPFIRWNGALKSENPVVLGAATARRWVLEKDIPYNEFDFMYYGQTIYSQKTFFGHAYAAAVVMNREKEIPAIGLNQVCTTSVTSLALAANDVELGNYSTCFCLSTDRTSSHSYIISPNPTKGNLDIENVVLDNFDLDPSPGAGLKMYRTAEAVAKERGITKEMCDEIVFMRYEQYKDALKNDRAFQKRYMFPIEIKQGKKIVVIDEDAGITPTTWEGLQKLKPVDEGGVVTYGGQTHPADGNCGIIVTTKEKAAAMSKDKNIPVQVLGYASVRVAPGRMAAAPAPALQAGCDAAGVKVSDLSQIKTHNPFAVNDANSEIVLGLKRELMNNYGSSMVYGHPQGPTAGRAICELIEALAVQGGGIGAFTGCAAGDIAGSIVIKVG